MKKKEILAVYTEKIKKESKLLLVDMKSCEIKKCFTSGRCTYDWRFSQKGR